MHCTPKFPLFLILHTLTKDEALCVKDRLVPHHATESEIELSWGNALVTADLGKKRDEEIDFEMSDAVGAA